MISALLDRAVAAVERRQGGDGAATAAISKTVPSPLALPASVVPYRLPPLSMISPACGLAPLRHRKSPRDWKDPKRG